MPCFVITSREFRKEVVLPDADITTIGRARSCDIVLPDANLKVSRSHAAVVRVPGQTDRYFIRDLSSAHGSRIGGRLFYQHVLRHGDIVQIGKYALRYAEGGDAGRHDDRPLLEELQPSQG